MNLVTGYRGVEHIKSADHGSFNAAFFGEGQFVMEIGQQMKAQLASSNKIRILDGDLLMKGRHIRIDTGSYEEVTIESGVAGSNRVDLIVAEYSKSATDGTESAVLKVIKGTSTTGTPTVPSYTNGDILNGATSNQMPLYKVTLSGVQISTIDKMFTTCPTYKALADKYESEFVEACRTYLNSLNILDTLSAITGNTSANQLAGGLGVKEFYNKAITTDNIKNQSVNYATSAGTTNVYGGKTAELSTKNTSDTYVPVLKDNKMQYRVIPTDYNNAPSTLSVKYAATAGTASSASTASSANSVAWGNVTSKPSTYTPSSHTHTKSQITDFSHTHDDRYYTETEMNTKLNGKSDTSHNHDSSYAKKGWTAILDKSTDGEYTVSNMDSFTEILVLFMYDTEIHHTRYIPYATFSFPNVVVKFDSYDGTNTAILQRINGYTLRITKMAKTWRMQVYGR